ncbi:MAG TPA: Hsp20/alpha crystallin family protein [Candidatus Binatia bacterium]|nr:Hsp20/alpha crystallin family protein [Candidatus Binatia bacterium]
MTDQELSVRNKQEVSREEATRPGRTYQPDVDIYETPDALWLWADMPGVDETQINVNLADGVLTLEGRVALEEYKDLSPTYTEYNVGNYLRRFTVSSDIDTDAIKARVTNGVLELELPKAERAKPRRISVSTA